jgi:hypothetical protein
LPKIPFLRIYEHFVQAASEAMVCAHEELQALLPNRQRFHCPVLQRSVNFAYLADAVLKLVQLPANGCAG